MIAVILIPISQSAHAQNTVGEIDQDMISDVENATATGQVISNSNISGVYSVKGPQESNQDNLQAAVSTAKCDSGDLATGGGFFVKGGNTIVAAIASEAVGADEWKVTGYAPLPPEPNSVTVQAEVRCLDITP
jgi:hypothetical protein